MGIFLRNQNNFPWEILISPAWPHSHGLIGGHSQTVSINPSEINIALCLESGALDCVTLGKSPNLSATIYVNELKAILATSWRESKINDRKIFRQLSQQFLPLPCFWCIYFFNVWFSLESKFNHLHIDTKTKRVPNVGWQCLHLAEFYISGHS